MRESSGNDARKYPRPQTVKLANHPCPGGTTVISRWLSAATPPDNRSEKPPTSRRDASFVCESDLDWTRDSLRSSIPPGLVCLSFVPPAVSLALNHRLISDIPTGMDRFGIDVSSFPQSAFVHVSAYESIQILWVIFDSGSFEKIHDFFTKRLPTMVFFLMCDVGLYAFSHSRAHRECRVAFLPGERLFADLFVNPK